MKINKTWLNNKIGSNLQPWITIIELYTIPNVVINISQSVAKFGFINLNEKIDAINSRIELNYSPTTKKNYELNIILMKIKFTVLMIIIISITG